MAYTISQNLNIRPKYFPHVVVHVSAGDANIPVHFSIYDGASPYTIPSGTTITVHGYRKDGGNWIVNGTYSGNVVSFTLPSAAMAIEGAGIADVVFTTGNEVVGSANFCLLVERATFPNGVAYSNDSSVFQDLLNFINSSAIPEAISDWLEENITETSPAVDSTLSVQGAAADAKATGDALTNKSVTQASLSGNVVSFKNANNSEKFTLDLSDLDDIKTITNMNQMTDESVVYNYTWTEGTTIHNQLYFYNGEWTPLGSGVRTAATASQMTDNNAIYKYTGSESGYVANALYYYNGTSWNQIPTMATVENAKNSVIDDLTDYKVTSASNIVDPSNYEHTTINNNDFIVSKEKIPIDKDLGVRFYGATSASQSGIVVQVWCYIGDEKVGETYFSFTNTANAFSVNENSDSIKLAFRVYGNATSMGQVCVSRTNFDEFIEFSTDVDNLKIKDSLIDSDAITGALTERTHSGNNIIDPLKMLAWGYTYDMSTGAKTSSSTQQLIKDPIEVGSNSKLYVIIRNPLSAAYGEGVIYCYNGDTFLGVRRSISLTSTAMQTVNLITGTTHIRPVLTTSPEMFNSRDFCVSWIPLEEFEEYEYSLKIKPSLLSGEQNLTGSKLSTLYMKNIVFFGDSHFHNNALCSSIGQKVGAKIYNASYSGSSMSCGQNGQTGATRYWYTGANIAKCIANDDWTDTLSAVQSISDMYQKATHLSELDWNSVDAIIFALGANDSATDNQENQKDITTYGGAARYIIEALGTAYPKLRVIFCSTIYSSTYNFLPLKTMLEQICESYNVPFIDNYTTLGVNSFNSSVYLIQDGVHQTEAGQELLVNHIVQELW